MKSGDSESAENVQITIQPDESTELGDPESDRLESIGKSAVNAGTATSACTAAAERAGVDRYAEAELAEQMHAKAYARDIGGTIVEEETSVFTPDGGVDRMIKGPAGEKTVQVKHYSDSLGESVLEQYSDVDVIATTNGLKDGVDPAEYGIDVVTIDDWSVIQRMKLSGTRIKRGATKPITSAASRIGTATKTVAGRAAAAARTGVSGFLRLSLGKQLLIASVLIVVVGGIVYFLWKRSQDDD
ncbi:hypothetical protein [Haloterrigena alkaliphila]|uniref:hypothetical protein n=1 Tax=Haloterrigena alkaliphila TaxID=2816475 RepID=UPI001CFFE12A|nr:hypothetical protein [Haloterrigena alkaliphila]QSW97655.2 hypothetical protein J0X25_09495 [Haloterrigena alkaliphila]